jgi:hypothetical protein
METAGPSHVGTPSGATSFDHPTGSRLKPLLKAYVAGRLCA